MLLLSVLDPVQKRPLASVTTAAGTLVLYVAIKAALVLLLAYDRLMALVPGFLEPSVTSAVAFGDATLSGVALGLLFSLLALTWRDALSRHSHKLPRNGLLFLLACSTAVVAMSAAAIAAASLVASMLTGLAFERLIVALLPGVATWQAALTLAVLTVMASVAVMATYSLTCLPSTLLDTVNQRGVYPSTVRRNIAYEGFVMTVFFVLFFLASS